MATLHASSLHQVAERALILGMLAGMSQSLTARLFAMSVDLVIQLSKTNHLRTIDSIGKPELLDGELSIRELSI